MTAILPAIPWSFPAASLTVWQGIVPFCTALTIVGILGYISNFRQQRQGVNLYSPAFINGAQIITRQLETLLADPHPTAKTLASYQSLVQGSEPFITRYALSALSLTGFDVAAGELKLEQAVLGSSGSSHNPNSSGNSGKFKPTRTKKVSFAQ